MNVISYAHTISKAVWSRITGLVKKRQSKTYSRKGKLTYSDKIVVGVRKWLGPEGVKYFRDLKEKHGIVSPVINVGGMPYAVHFREGMQVRNQLRLLTKHKWTDHQYDNVWQEIVERAITDEYDYVDFEG